MNNSRPEFTPDAGERAKAVQQGIDQGSAVSIIVRSSGSRVDHHSRRLIYHCQVVIFVNYVEGNFFRDGTQRRPFDFADNFNVLASTEKERCLCGFPIDENLFLRYKLLDSRTAGIGESRDQEVVEPPAGVLGNDDEICLCFQSQATRCHSERSRPAWPARESKNPFDLRTTMNLDGNSYDKPKLLCV